ncbi:MAG TPA: 50S ribosomal protein L6 [Candidatus Omnitrophota bacterium]|nr:50S ribosomal protein L6 [Candidatus Omnitrophota bacterium]
MSRLAKVPVVIPDKVKVTVVPGNIHLEGPKGKLDLKVPQGVTVEQKENKLLVNRTSDQKQARASQGSVRAHLANFVEGLVNGHKKELEIQGIGFRASLQGKKVLFNLGLSHPVEFEIPADVDVKIPTQTSIIVEGTNNMRVGLIAAQIKALKPVEPYKGKGIRYVGEVVRRKQGKSVTK